jgi:hypothetical protein
MQDPVRNFGQSPVVGGVVAVVMAARRADVHGSRVLMASAFCCQPERFERHRIRAPRALTLIILIRTAT